MHAITRLPSSRMNDCELSFTSRSPIDIDRAIAQHAEYRALLKNCGADVTLLGPSPDLPDCTFVEDTAVVLEEIAIITSPGAPSRRAEVDDIAEALRPHRPLEWVRLPATLDGGDVVHIGRTLLVGLSARTNGEGVAALHEIGTSHGHRVWPVAIRECLHLKSACTALDERTLLANPAWIEPEAFRALSERYQIVIIPPAEPFAADVLRIGTKICLPAAHQQTAALIAELGFEVLTVDLSEFAKAEGGVTCLSIIF
jgi:dimethylargininase